MQPRNLIETFSTWIEFDDRGFFCRWVTPSLKLRRSMESCLSVNSSRSVEFWCLYWFKVWEQQLNILAKEHLSAYLQVTLYQVAKEFYSRYQNRFSEYSTPDYFQIGTLHLERVYQKFNPRLGLFGIHAKVTLKNAITDEIRVLDRSAGHSNLSLLFYSSERRLERALAMAGISGKIQEQYLLAWDCFKAIYPSVKSAKNKQSGTLDASAWDAIAEQYNYQASQNDRSATGANVESWMDICSQALRNYCYPSKYSLNQPLSGEDNKELQETIADPQQIDILESQSDLELSQKINGVLQEKLAEVERLAAPTSQHPKQSYYLELVQIISLYYGEGLKQKAIAERVLGTSQQYTVSRRLAEVNKMLLQTLCTWATQELHIPVDSNLINTMNMLITDWLSLNFENK